MSKEALKRFTLPTPKFYQMVASKTYNFMVSVGMPVPKFYPWAEDCCSIVFAGHVEAFVTKTPVRGSVELVVYRGETPVKLGAITLENLRNAMIRRTHSDVRCLADYFL